MIQNKNTTTPQITYILIFFLFSFFFFLLTCSSPNDNENTVTFSGTVTLEGEEDHSGVTVSLYEPVELDTALVRINREYPHIGVQISQETEFDHREHEPVYTTKTGADGSWKIDDVNEGEYNVVAEKEGFGRTIRYEQTIDQDKAGMTFTLKPKITLTGVYNQDYVFDSQFIEVSGDAVFETGSTARFKGECIIHFQGPFSLTIKGAFTQEVGSVVRLFADDLTSDARWEFINQTDLTLQQIYAMGDVELRIAESKVRITNSYFRKANLYALNLSNCNLSLRNLLFRGNNIGLNINKTSGENELIHNVYFGNEIDVEAFSADALFVNNNMFNHSILNLNFIMVNALVKYNNFENSEKNMNMADISDIQLFKNHLKSNKYNFYFTRVSHQNYPVKIMASENNFLNTIDYYFVLQRRTVYGDTVYASNNYWGTTNEQLIKIKITDQENYPDTPGFGYVKYIPLAVEIVDISGIQY